MAPTYQDFNCVGILLKSKAFFLFAAGVFGPCPALYDGMEIKHIMNDTLG